MKKLMAQFRYLVFFGVVGRVLLPQ